MRRGLPNFCRNNDVISSHIYDMLHTVSVTFKQIKLKKSNFRSPGTATFLTRFVENFWLQIV